MSQKPRDVIRTYLELPGHDRSPAIDRLLNATDYAEPAPNTAAIVSRHIRLSLIIGDLYQSLSDASVPDNQGETQSLPYGDERTMRKLDRAYTLLGENERRARLLTGLRDEPHSSRFLDRLNETARQRRTRWTTLHTPELENDL